MVVARKVRDFVDTHKPNRLEWLKVTIFDHKKKVASDDFWIANPLDVVDAIDKQNSKILWNRIDTNEIAGCTKLVLLPQAIAPEKLIFRLKHLGSAIVVRMDLGKAIKAAGFTGVRMVDIEEFTGF